MSDESKKKKSSLSKKEKAIIAGIGGSFLGGLLALIIYLVVRTLIIKEDAWRTRDAKARAMMNSTDPELRALGAHYKTVNDDVATPSWEEFVGPIGVGVGLGAIAVGLIAGLTALTWGWALVIGIGIAAIISALGLFGVQAWDMHKLDLIEERAWRGTPTSGADVEQEAVTAGAEAEATPEAAPEKDDPYATPVPKKKKRKSEAEKLVEEITELTELPVKFEEAA